MMRKSRILRFGLAFFGVVALFFATIATYQFRNQSITQNNFQKQDAVGLAANSQPDQRVLGEKKGAVWFSKQNNSYSGSSVISYSSIEEPVLNISARDTKEKTFTVSAYPINKQDLLGLLLYEKEVDNNGHVTSSQFLQQFLDTSNRQATAITTVEVSNQSSNSVTLPLAEQGIWYVYATNGDVFNRAVLIRSALGTLVKSADDRFVYWSEDFKSKQAAPNVTITQLGLNSSIQQLGQGQTDREGLLKLPYNVDVDIALAEQNGDLALIPVNLQNTSYLDYKQFGVQQSISKIFLFSDRALYQPGDTVNYKAIVRDSNDGRYSLPSGVMYVRLYQDNNLISEQIKQLSEWSSLDGSFLLDKNAKPGYYSLSISAQPANPEARWYSYDSEIGFDVEYYTKPDYHVSITGSQMAYVKGDTISALIQAQYFSGQPIANGAVTYSVSSFDFNDYGYLSQYYAERDQYQYWWWGGSNPIQSGKLELDAKGSAVYSIDTGELMAKDGDSSKVFSLLTEYIDSSGVKVKAQKYFMVYESEYGVYQNQGSDWSSRVNTPTSMELIVINRRTGAPVPNVDLRLSAQRNWWERSSNPNASSYGDIYSEKNEPVAISNLKTNAQGVASLAFTPDKSGSYQFKVETNDSKDNKITRQLYWYVWGGNDYWFSGVSGEEMAIIPDKKTYKPGETAYVTLMSSTLKEASVLVTIERGLVWETKVANLQAGQVMIPIEIKKQHMPGITVAAHTFLSSTLATAQQNLSISAEQQDMQISINSDRPIYGPGESVTLTVETKDGLGNPVAGELALWAMDKSLLELRESNLYQKIFDRFWQRQYYWSRLSHSLAGISENAAEMGGGCFAEETKIMMADGTEKAIKDVTEGDSVQSFANPQSQQLESFKVTSTHQAQVAGLLIINGYLKTTPDHKLWINQEWGVAGSLQIGDSLHGYDGQPVVVESLEWVLGKQTVYNLEVEQAGTFIAEGIYVHNEKGAVRDNFQDIAYWNPSVITDGSGRATVRFKLPDNLTTWAVTAIGATKDTVVGQVTTEFKVSKDLVVRPVLPQFVRIGDLLSVSSLAHNFTDSDLGVEVSLTAEKGVVTPQEPVASTLPSQGLDQYFWEYQPADVPGDDLLRFSVVDAVNDESDIVEKILPVKPYGFTQASSYAGSGTTKYAIGLESGADPNRSEVTVLLSPSIIGSLEGALNYLVDYPYGCIEQTTSRFVPLIVALKEPELFSSALKDKDADAMFKAGIGRLTALQNSDGGWGWWYDQGHNPYVTAYVLDYLIEARQLGMEVPDALTDGAQRFFNNMAEKSDEEKVLKRFGLSLLNTKDLLPIHVDVLNRVTDDYLSLGVLTNVRLGDLNPETNGAAILLARANTGGGLPNWQRVSPQGFYSRNATGMAIRALVAAQHGRETAVQAARYQMQTRDKSYWGNTYETAQLVRAMVELYRSGGEDTPNFSYTVMLDDTKIAGGKVQSAKTTIAPIIIPGDKLTKGGSNLEVSMTGTGQLYSTVDLSEFITDRELPEKKQGLQVERSYQNLKGEGYSYGLGDEIQVEIKVRGQKGNMSYLVVEDPVPAGWTVINTRLKNESDQSWSNDSWYGWYSNSDRVNKEIYPDKVVFALGESENRSVSSAEEVKIFTYKVRAILPGTYGVPPTQARLMYSPEIMGRSGSEVVKIDAEATFDPSRVKPKTTETLIKTVADKPQGTSLWMMTALALLLIVVSSLVVLRRQKNLHRSQQTPTPTNLSDNHDETTPLTSIEPEKSDSSET